ncbi:class I adenylate-forming enzyme family protein [Hyphomonas oceanitis]|uniref:class I adenylate-forming enzyme family protein n=1 Tax=Hyphomonas oceanitis TaxID=81033 RepID=UPI00300282E1
MSDISERVAEVLRLQPEAGAVDYHGNWTSWGALDEAATRLRDLLDQSGLDPRLPVGWIANKRPSAVATFAALLALGRPIAPLRANASPDQFLAEIEDQKLGLIIGDLDTWKRPGTIEAARSAGSAGIAFADEVGLLPDWVDGLTVQVERSHRTIADGTVIERLSSGTTGAPKRIPVSTEVLASALKSADQASGKGGSSLQVKTSPTIIMSPFTHAGGIFGLLFALYQARPIVLIDKFEIAAWSDIMQRHRPKSASLVPAMIRMILDADVPADVLSSLKAVRSGTAPLDPGTQAEFERRYGIPVLIDYGATEFIGGVAGWSLADHETYAISKRGSVGRPRPDVHLRAVDGETGTTKSPGDVGLLEIRAKRFGPDWVRTNDLASLDSDGFLYIHGRADDVINRGGFKILPDEVISKIRLFPGVRDAALIGKPDTRLGEVPVAVIETQDGRALDVAALDAFLSSQVARYQHPVDYKFVAALPRTNTLKVQVRELRRQFDFEPAASGAKS